MLVLQPDSDFRIIEAFLAEMVVFTTSTFITCAANLVAMCQSIDLVSMMSLPVSRNHHSRRLWPACWLSMRSSFLIQETSGSWKHQPM